MGKHVAVNEAGYLVGETHPNAKLSDREVDLVRELHEEHGHSPSVIADWFNATKEALVRICRYERRAQTPARWKRK